MSLSTHLLCPLTLAPLVTLQILLLHSIIGPFPLFFSQFPTAFLTFFPTLCTYSLILLLQISWLSFYFSTFFFLLTSVCSCITPLFTCPISQFCLLIFFLFFLNHSFGVANNWWHERIKPQVHQILGGFLQPSAFLIINMKLFPSVFPVPFHLWI